MDLTSRQKQQYLIRLLGAKPRVGRIVLANVERKLRVPLTPDRQLRKIVARKNADQGI